jgi:hypothetical protein
MLYLRRFMTVEDELSLIDSISRKNIYIIKTIIIIMREYLQKKEIQELYKNAIYEHLLRGDDYNYRAEVKARRRMARYDEL